MLLGFIMTVSISTNISDSILQENQLANGIERANKAEVYTGKMNDAFFGNDGYFIGDQINNLDISDDELAQMKAIKHVKGVYPFDVFDTINQIQNVSTTSVYFQGNKVNFDYLQDGSPLVAPYYSFQNIYHIFHSNFYLYTYIYTNLVYIPYLRNLIDFQFGAKNYK